MPPLSISNALAVPLDHRGRLHRCVKALDEAEADALLVTNLTNIRYLTGFSGSAAMLWVGADEIVFVSDGRYRDQAAAEIGGNGEVRIEIGKTEADQREALQSLAIDGVRIGVEADVVSWTQHHHLNTTWFENADLVATSGLVEALRVTKEPGEIARIEVAAEIADGALVESLNLLDEGWTETRLAVELESRMRLAGADGPAYDTIVGSGPNSARPHARPTQRAIASTDLVVIDVGATVDGYRSDMTRTVMLGVPNERQAQIYDIVERAQATAVAGVEPGEKAAAIDALARDSITTDGFGEAFSHGCGHGVGLDIHEKPAISKVSAEVLEPGNIITVEPGVYLPEVGGVRIEDSVLVTPDGCRTLTRAQKSISI